MKLDKEKREEGTIKTVKDMIKCLKTCDPKAEISTWPENIGFHVQEYPDDSAVCIHVVELEINRRYPL